MQKIFDLNLEIIKEIYEKYLNSLQKRNDENSVLFPNGNVAFKEISELLSSLKLENFAKIIEVIFSSSLQKEEGLFHDFSIKIVPDLNILDSTNEFILDSLKDLYVFKRPIVLESLPKLAPALQNPKQEMYVWTSQNENPIIWAFGKKHFDNISIKINVSAPGQLIIETPFSLSEMTSPNNLFLLNFSKAAFRSSDFQHLFSDKYIDKYLGLDLETIIKNKKELFKVINFQKIVGNIILKMKQHKHGGTLLIAKDELVLTESIQENSIFAPKSHYTSIGRSIFYKENTNVREELCEPVEFYIDSVIEEKLSLLGQLTAVDGATIITEEFNLLAFGAKIKPINVDNKPQKVTINEPFENTEETKKELADLGGTRHQSAAQFVYDQKDSFAIVASQDGKISVMYWDKEIEGVRVVQHAEYLFM
ncbi:MAG TPA: diadenylate cyclase [Pyrinomonadaceae bacterium]|nr:diadenylate cyclase [Pyrinomonadaceae bacterium]